MMKVDEENDLLVLCICWMCGKCLSVLFVCVKKRKWYNKSFINEEKNRDNQIETLRFRFT